MSTTTKYSALTDTSDDARAVSVVMITYNHAAYIEEAIKSVLAQDFNGSLELIIGDDCSSDGTDKIILDFHQQHPDIIKLMNYESNVGMHENFRRCVLACKGNYIALCEGDDYWNSPDKIQLQINELEKTPGLAAIHSDFSHSIKLLGHWRTLEGFNAHYHRAIPVGNIFDELIKANFIQTCTLVIKKEYMLEYYKSSLPITDYSVGDWPLCLFISMTAEIAYLDKPLATYRHTPGSITNSGYRNAIARAKNAMRMADDFHKLHQSNALTISHSHAAAYLSMLKTSYMAGDRTTFNHAWQWLELHTENQLTSAWFKRFHDTIDKPVLRFLIMKYILLDEYIARLRNYKST
jgi:glycosyltransferase involved in cell wall biosynthesis